MKSANHLDGFITVYKDSPVRNAFGAKLNQESMSVVFSDCPFCEMSHRQGDVEFAEQMGFSLSLKCRIQYCDLLKKTEKYKAVIDGSRYDVQYFDKDSKYTYLYLEYIEEVET